MGGNYTYRPCPWCAFRAALAKAWEKDRADFTGCCLVLVWAVSSIIITVLCT